MPEKQLTTIVKTTVSDEATSEDLDEITRAIDEAISGAWLSNTILPDKPDDFCVSYKGLKTVEGLPKVAVFRDVDGSSATTHGCDMDVLFVEHPDVHEGNPDYLMEKAANGQVVPTGGKDVDNPRIFNTYDQMTGVEDEQTQDLFDYTKNEDRRWSYSELVAKMLAGETDE